MPGTKVESEKRGKKRQRDSADEKKKPEPRKNNNKVQLDANWKTLLGAGVIKRRKHGSGQSSGKSKDATVQEESVYPKINWTRKDAMSKESKIVAIDCEMVGCGRNKTSELARVCILNEEGNVLLDSFCKPVEKVTDYRTEHSGIRPKNLVNAPGLFEVQHKVAALIKGKILVGHALKNDLQVLQLKHPSSLLRDTSHYAPFRIKTAEEGVTRAPKLKDLVAKELGQLIQEGEHDPYIDARASLELYKKHRKAWEGSILENRKSRKERRNMIKQSTKDDSVVDPSHLSAKHSSTQNAKTSSQYLARAHSDDIFKSSRASKPKVHRRRS